MMIDRNMLKIYKIVEATISLKEGIDYEINDYQGRVTLVKPLSQFAADSIGSIIKDDLQDNAEYYLIAEYDYEYEHQKRQRICHMVVD